MALRLEGGQALAMATASGLGILMFWWLYSHLGFDAIAAGIVAALLPAVCLAYLLILKRNKPARHDRETLEHVAFRVATLAAGKRPFGTPPRLFHETSGFSKRRPILSASLEDVFVTDDMMVSLSGNKTRVAAGLAFTLPGLDNVDTASLRTFEDALRAVLRAHPPTSTLQIRWQIDHRAYLDPLLAYRKVTEAHTRDPWVERQRNLLFVDHHERHDRNQLRHATVEVFLALDFHRGKNRDFDRVIRAANPVFSQFRRAWANFAARFGGHTSPLENGELFLACTRFLNPTQAFDMAKGAAFDDLLSVGENCLLGEGVPLLQPNHGIYLNGAYWSVMLMKGLPKATFMGMILQLTNLDAGDLSVVTNSQILDVKSVIDAKEAKARKLENNLAHNRRPRLRAAIDREHAKIHRLMADEIVPCKTQFIIVVRGTTPEELRTHTEMVRNAIFQMHGATPYEVASAPGTRNYLLAAMPGNVTPYNDGHLELEDHHLADLLPLSGTPTADLDQAEAIFDGVHRNLLGIATFSNNNPLHTLISGSTGSGKSMLLGRLLTETAPFYARTYIIDNGQSHVAWAQAMDATVITIRPNGNECFNYFDTQGLPLTPLHMADTVAMAHVLAGHQADDDRNQRRAALLASAIGGLFEDAVDEWLRKDGNRLKQVTLHWLAQRQWLTSGVSSVPGDHLDAFLKFREWSHRHPGPFQAALGAVPEEDVDACVADPSLSDEIRRHALAFMARDDYPTHRQLVELLHCEGQASEPEAEEKLMLSRLLEPWCRGGPYGNLVDGPSNVDLTNPIVLIELGSIPESARNMRNVAAHLMTNYFRQAITTRPRGERKRLIIEELGGFLDIKGGADIARELFERMRKYSCWVVAVIQQVRTIDEAVCNAIMANCKMALLLKQADQGELKALTESIPLPDSTIEQILAFPEPTRESGAYFAWVRISGSLPRIAIGRNLMNPEAYAVSTTTGSEFEDRQLEDHQSLDPLTQTQETPEP